MMTQIYKKVAAFAVFFIAGLCAYTAHAQELIPYQNNAYWGYKDAQGKIVVKATYDSLGEFIDGYNIVVKRGKKGIIDSLGKLTVKTIFDEISPIDLCHGDSNDRLYIVKLNDKYGLITATNTVVLDGTYDGITPDVNGGLIIEQNGKMGYATTLGKHLLSCEYDKIESISGIGYILEKDAKKGYATLDGKIVMRCSYNNIVLTADNTLQLTMGENTGIADLKGTLIIPCLYNEFISINDELMMTRIGDFYGIMTKDGNTLLNCDNQEIKNVRLLFMFKRNDLWGVATMRGEIILEPMFLEMPTHKFDDCWTPILSNDGKVYILGDDNIVGWEAYDEALYAKGRDAYLGDKAIPNWAKRHIEIHELNYPTPKRDIGGGLRMLIPGWFTHSVQEYQEGSGEELRTHSSHATINVDKFTISYIETQDDKELLFYVTNSEQQTTTKIGLPQILKQLNATMLNAAVENNKPTFAFATEDERIIIGFDAYLSVATTSKNIYASTNAKLTLRPKNNTKEKPHHVILSINSQTGAIVGCVALEEMAYPILSNFGGFYLTQPSTQGVIAKLSSACKIEWQTPTPAASAVRFVRETTTSLYMGGSTLASAETGTTQPTLWRLDPKSGATLASHTFASCEGELFNISANGSGIVNKTMEPEVLSMLEPFEPQPFIVEWGFIRACGLVDLHGNWLIKPLMPHEKHQTYGNWMIHPFYYEESGECKERVMVSYNGQHSMIDISQNAKVYDEASRPESHPATITPENYLVHIIQEGETIDTIASIYSATSEVIAGLNPEINVAALNVGQPIRVPNL